MPNEVQHDGCWNCGSEDDPMLQSKTIYDVQRYNKREQRMESPAPYSIAVCSKPACQAVEKIDLTTRKAVAA